MKIQNGRKRIGFFRALVYLEIVGFVGSYFTWRRLNNSQDFRYYMSNTAPFILDGYYKMGEKLGNLKTREFDANCWKERNKKDF